MKNIGIIDPWIIGVSHWDASSIQDFESLLAIGNGRMGQRANFEEGYTGVSMQGSYLAGIYYPDKTRVGWWKNGYPEYFAKVLNSTNWIAIDVRINGVALDLNSVETIHDFSWQMDMRNGILSRKFEVTISDGTRVKVETERFCSMNRPELGCIRYRIWAAQGDVELIPSLDADVQNEDSNWDDQFWEVHAIKSNEAGSACIHASTLKTDFHVALEMKSDVHRHGTQGDKTELITDKEVRENNKIGWSYGSRLEQGEWLEVQKYVGVCTSMNHSKNEIDRAVTSACREAWACGWEKLVADHKKVWSGIWNQADIVIDGDDRSQQAIRFNIFHLNQTYRGDDPRLNIGPKGFTGEKYGGASYWDTEAYCLPFFLAGHPPQVAKQLLLYRYHHLGRAIENAQKLGFEDGAALYPMVTMNGEECHNEWEITFEEIHRNGAMSYAIWNYVNYTGDREYLIEFGFPVLLGVARFWNQRAQWSDHRKAYVILGVTGPNEYENNVNNNWYTNYIAAWCLEYAREVGQWIQREHPAAWSALVREYSIDAPAIFNNWEEVSNQMFLPKLEGTKIMLQQDGFMDKEQLKASDLDESQRPINQHWSWDRILRSIFIKQADVLQGIYFFWDHFDHETRLANYEFYEPKTVHESSLSPCVHAILAVRLGKMEDAYAHYQRTARLDLDDYNREVHEGLHVTSMAGTWLSVVEGFGGYRVRDGRPCFSGCIPEIWSGLRFKVNFRNRLMEVSVNGDSTQVELISGSPLEVEVNGELQLLETRR
ncbi:MAG: family 65 glycosyl hydrolase domain-containing protein [Flavobacteriales bacterium]